MHNARVTELLPLYYQPRKPHINDTRLYKLRCGPARVTAFPTGFVVLDGTMRKGNRHLNILSY
jgi:hypothetical protein